MKYEKHINFLFHISYIKKKLITRVAKLIHLSSSSTPHWSSRFQECKVEAHDRIEVPVLAQYTISWVVIFKPFYTKKMEVKIVMQLSLTSLYQFFWLECFWFENLSSKWFWFEILSSKWCKLLALAIIGTSSPSSPQSFFFFFSFH